MSDQCIKEEMFSVQARLLCHVLHIQASTCSAGKQMSMRTCSGRCHSVALPCNGNLQHAGDHLWCDAMQIEVCRLQGALSNYGYRWGWFAIGCIFQVLIVAGLLLTGAARPAYSAVQSRVLGPRDRDWQLSMKLH